MTNYKFQNLEKTFLDNILEQNSVFSPKIFLM
jgi:hypothetical protein